MQLEFSKREIIEQAFISKIDYMKEIIDLKNKEIQFLKQSWIKYLKTLNKLL